MVGGTYPTDHLSCSLSLAFHPHLLLHVTNLRIQMKDLDVVAFGVFGGEGTPGTHIGYFAKDLNRLRFPLLVDRVGILYFKTRNDAAMRQGNAIGLFRSVLQGKRCPSSVRGLLPTALRIRHSALAWQTAQAVL